MPKNQFPDDMGENEGHDILGDESFLLGESGYPNYLSGVNHPSGKNQPFETREAARKHELNWPAKRLSDVVLKVLNWLWRGFLPVGKVVCLYGIGGVGKTTIIIDLVARLTTKAIFPDGSTNETSGTVVFLTGEDGVADTVLPRLLAAGGDPSKVFVLDSIFTLRDKPHILNLSDIASVSCLEEKLTEFPGLVLLVIDPITGFMGGADSHKIGDVRGCLSPLIRIADNLGITIVFIHHCNKSVSQSAAHRASGSTAFIDAVRTAIMCCQNPDDPKNRRVLSVTKSNLAEIPPGIGYTLRTAPGMDVARVEWESGRVSLSADELLAASQGDGMETTAEDFLRELLADGPMAARDVMTVIRDNGYSPKCIRRAFEYIGGKPRKGDFKGGWVWELPGEPKIPQDSEDAQS